MLLFRGLIPFMGGRSLHLGSPCLVQGKLITFSSRGPCLLHVDVLRNLACCLGAPFFPRGPLVRFHAGLAIAMCMLACLSERAHTVDAAIFRCKRSRRCLLPHSSPYRTLVFTLSPFPPCPLPLPIPSISPLSSPFLTSSSPLFSLSLWLSSLSVSPPPSRTLSSTPFLHPTLLSSFGQTLSELSKLGGPRAPHVAPRGGAEPAELAGG